MIKAIIFDCFGVLVSEAWQPFKAQYFGQDKQKFQQATDLNKQADAGMLSRQDFIEQTAALAGVPEQTVVNALTANAPNEPLFEYIKQLKPKYKIGFLSNTSANRLDTLFTPEQLALFDAVSLSIESGLIKPLPKAYEEIAEKLGLETCEAVLVDDKEKHCAGAREAGMHAILYRDLPSFKAELEQLLKT